MEMYLATPGGGTGCESDWKNLSILESFWYARKDNNFDSYYPTARKFLCDSGAFTWMDAVTKGKKVARIDWEDYTRQYIEFINRYNIDQFIEMDIDKVAGLKKAEELRAMIERGTGKQPIPVWHINRGKDYFVGMCKDYPYVAFGGLMSDGRSRQELEKVFPWFIETAHEHGAKIHGLGYTSLDGLMRFNWDSVDSSSWSAGFRFGKASKFNAATGKMKSIDLRAATPPGKKIYSGPALRANEWNEWVKLQKYLRTH